MQIIKSALIPLLCLSYLLTRQVELRQMHNKTLCNLEKDHYYIAASREVLLNDLAEGNLRPPFGQSLFANDKENCGENLMFDFSEYSGFECLKTGSNRSTDEQQASGLNRAHVRGGSEVEPGEFPMFASLDINITGRAKKRCSGSLISDNVIITAAHCTGLESSINVTLGHVKKDGSGQRFQVKGFCRSPAYRKEGAMSDVAIVILDRPVRRDAFVQPACLELDKRPTEEAQCWIVGSGRRSPFDKRPDTVKALPVHRCPDPSDRNDQGCFIANSGENPGSICRGDSGGPTVCIDTCGGSAKMVVVGASSRSKIDCEQDYYKSKTADFFKLKDVIMELLTDCQYRRARIY